MSLPELPPLEEIDETKGKIKQKNPAKSKTSLPMPDLEKEVKNEETKNPRKTTKNNLSIKNNDTKTPDTPIEKTWTVKKAGRIQEEDGSIYNAAGKGDEYLGNGWFVDEKTKVKYRGIPKLTKDNTKEGAKSLLSDELDSFNINKTSKQFLGHLQVPPDDKEIQKLRKIRDLQEKRRNEEYEKMWAETEEEIVVERTSLFSRIKNIFSKNNNE